MGFSWKKGSKFSKARKNGFISQRQFFALLGVDYGYTLIKYWPPLQWRNWLARLTSNQKVAGSSPAWSALFCGQRTFLGRCNWNFCGNVRGMQEVLQGYATGGRRQGCRDMLNTGLFTLDTTDPVFSHGLTEFLLAPSQPWQYLYIRGKDVKVFQKRSSQKLPFGTPVFAHCIQYFFLPVQIKGH